MTRLHDDEDEEELKEREADPPQRNGASSLMKENTIHGDTKRRAPPFTDAERSDYHAQMPDSTTEETAFRGGIALPRTA